jgi:hypothetical protein
MQIDPSFTLGDSVAIAPENTALRTREWLFTSLGEV